MNNNINNNEVLNTTEAKAKEVLNNKEATTDTDTFLYIANAKKSILPVNKALYVYRLNIAPTTKARIKYSKAFEYLKQLIKVINNTEHDRLQRDSRYFYFQEVAKLNEQEQTRFKNKIKEINSQILNENKKVYNITIGLDKLLSYKTHIDKFYKVDINSIINNK